MRCPNCQHQNTKVIDSRHADDMTVIRRRRECESCGTRFTTFERIELSPLVVIKKDNTREKFDREKVLEGLRSEEHTSELQSRFDLVCRLLLGKKINQF